MILCTFCTYTTERIEANLQAESQQNMALNTEVAQLKQDIIIATKRQSKEEAQVLSLKIASLERELESKQELASTVAAIQRRYDEEKQTVRALQEELQSTQARLEELAHRDDNASQGTQQTRTSLQSQESNAQERLKEAHQNVSHTERMLTEMAPYTTKKHEEGGAAASIGTADSGRPLSPRELALQAQIDALTRDFAVEWEKFAKMTQVPAAEWRTLEGEEEAKMEGDRSSQKTGETNHAKKVWFPRLCNGGTNGGALGESQKTVKRVWFPPVLCHDNSHMDNVAALNEEESLSTFNTYDSTSLPSQGGTADTSNSSYEAESPGGTLSRSVSDVQSSLCHTQSDCNSVDRDSGAARGSHVDRGAKALVEESATVSNGKSVIGSLMNWFSGSDMTAEGRPKQGTTEENGTTAVVADNGDVSSL